MLQLAENNKKLTDVVSTTTAPPAAVHVSLFTITIRHCTV